MLDFPPPPGAPQIGDRFPDPHVPTLPEWEWDGEKWVRPLNVGGGGPSVPHCGRLVHQSNTVLRFVPHNGDQIQIDGVIYQIPDVGIYYNVNYAGTPGVTLYLYIWYDANVPYLIIEASETGHETDTRPENEGVEIKQGDPSRSLVGMIYRQLAGQPFRDTPQQRLVASWFNRRWRTLSSPMNGTSTSTPTELGLLETLWWTDANDTGTLGINLAGIGQMQMSAASGGTIQLKVNIGYVGAATPTPGQTTPLFMPFPQLPYWGPGSGYAYGMMEGYNRLALEAQLFYGASLTVLNGSLTGRVFI